MSDIITQVEQVIIDHTSDDVSYGELAQALADAGLLAEPARTVPTREEIAAVTHLYEIDENDHLMPRTRWEIADAVLALIGQRETKDVYELAAERIGTESTWTVDAREALGLTRTVPTRDEIVDVILDTHLFDGGTPIDTADAILALLADQPAVAEAKAQALEEAADAWHAENAGTSPRAYWWLQHRAQQHRDGE